MQPRVSALAPQSIEVSPVHAQPCAPLAHQVPQACARLGVGRTVLYELIKSGELKVIKFGTRTLVPETELVRLIENRLQAAA